MKEELTTAQIIALVISSQLFIISLIILYCTCKNEVVKPVEEMTIPDEMDYALDEGVYHFELESGQEN